MTPALHKKLIASICFILLSQLPIGCCGPFPDSYTSITAIEGSTGVISSGQFEADDYVLCTSRLALRVQVSGTNYWEAARKTFPFSLSTTAYACSEPPTNATQALQSIAIYSDAPLRFNGVDYAPGTDLSPFFDVMQFPFDRLALPLFLRDQRSNNELFGPYGSTILLVFNQLPEQNMDHSFRVLLRFEDGNEFDVDCGTITTYEGFEGSC